MLQDEIFRKVTNHLMNQKEASFLPCVDEETGEEIASDECAYRGHNGTSCAVGCLIDDEFYSESLEHGILEETNYELIKALALSLAISESQVKEHIPILRNLQQIHDRIDPDKWEDAFVMLGKMYGVFGSKYSLC